MRLVEMEKSEKHAFDRQPIQSELFPQIRAEDIQLVASEKSLTVICRGFCLFTFGREDRFSRNYCIVQMHLAGGINLQRLSKIFGLSYVHCSRTLRKYKKEGVDGLREGIANRFLNRRLIDDDVGELIKKERGKGRTFGEIVEIVRFKFKKKIREKSIRAWMSRTPGSGVMGIQREMFDSEKVKEISDLKEEHGWRRNVYAGSMILHGMLHYGGFLRPFEEHIREDDKDRESNSSVRRIILTLFFLHVLRFRSIEQGKHIVGRDFEDLVGGDFLRLQPLRNAVDEIVGLAGFDRAMDAYSRDLIAQTDCGEGFYYTDGHFSTYYGRRKVPKGDDPRRQMPYNGRNTIYMHNSMGEIVYLFESPTNTSLSNDIEKLISDVASHGMKLKRKTLGFDRGGFSAKCFRFLHRRKMYFVSYLKNRKKERESDRNLFISQRFETEDGEQVEYKIFERERVLKSYGRIRIIVLLGTDGEQIPIMTSNPYLRAATVIYFLKRRWREENCFKYMIEHFGIDLLCTYKTERAPTKIIKRPNRERRDVTRLIQQKRAELMKLKGELGEKILIGSREQTVEKFFETQKQLEFQMKSIGVDIDALERKKSEMPTKTEINLADDHVIIAQKRRLFINAIKAMNYNAEKWLQIFFKEHHKKTDETLSLIRSLWDQPGRIKKDGQVVEVVLEPLDQRSMQMSLERVLEKLKETNCLRLPNGKLLRIS